MTLEYGRALRRYDTAQRPFHVFGTNGPIGWNDEALSKGASVIVGRKGAYRGIHYSARPCFVIDTAFYLNMLPMDALQIPQIVVPARPVLAAFNDLTEASRRRHEKMIDESRTLTALRYALLPYLISGELRVKRREEICHIGRTAKCPPKP